MDYTSDFKQDLREAIEIENEFLKTFITAHMKRNNTSKRDYKYKKGNNKDGDVYIKFLKEKKELLFEVKDDKRGKGTGNIVIEFESRGKPSGIVTTQSDYWVQKHDGTFYIMDVQSLRQAINEKKYFDVVVGGDNNTSLLYRFKRDDYVDIVVDSMTNNKLSMIL